MLVNRVNRPPLPLRRFPPPITWRTGRDFVLRSSTLQHSLATKESYFMALLSTCRHDAIAGIAC
ncbi:hypothetical protein KFU94_39030 [Chloroflexi bacterium TSY]|nr:hypothetical protein [Chloroflexi bacterium TSY]